MTLATVHMRGVLAAIFAVAMTMIGYGFGPPLAGVSSDLFRALGVAEPLRWALVVTASFFALSGVVFLRAAAAIEKMKHIGNPDRRSEERRVGKEGVSTGKSRWSPDD